MDYCTLKVMLASSLPDVELTRLKILHRPMVGRRWSVDLHIRSLKTQIRMAHQRCQIPLMIRKEIHRHLIRYNLIHTSMLGMRIEVTISSDASELYRGDASD